MVMDEEVSKTRKPLSVMLFTLNKASTASSTKYTIPKAPSEAKWWDCDRDPLAKMILRGGDSV